MIKVFTKGLALTLNVNIFTERFRTDLGRLEVGDTTAFLRVWLSTQGDIYHQNGSLATEVYRRESGAEDKILVFR